MKQSKLSKLENQYYYGISRYFWHIVIGLGVLAIIAGVLVYAWSQIPPRKQEVVKGIKPQRAEYPKLRTVGINEILRALPKDTPKPPPTSTTTYEEPPVDDIIENQLETVDSTAIYNFEIELGTTRSLISEEKHQSFWKGSGTWGFASERDKKMYKKTKNPKYKKWIPQSSGFKKRFVSYTKRQGLDDYNDKTKLLKSFNEIIKQTTPDNRIKIINEQLLQKPVGRIGLYKILNIYETIAKLIGKIEENNQISAFYLLYKFALRNPNDGLALINYESHIIDSLPNTNRLDFIKQVQKEYINNYNNNLNSLTQATDKFIPYLKQLAMNRQVEALKIYYKLYRKNNRELNQQIKEIDNNYRKEVADWEKNFRERLSFANMEYENKLRKKREYRWWSYKGIGYGFITILIISLFLLILSMIRNVNRLSEAMLENNKLFVESISSNKAQQEDAIREVSDENDLEEI